MKERDLENEKLSKESDGRDVRKKLPFMVYINFLISLCFVRD